MKKQFFALALTLSVSAGVLSSSAIAASYTDAQGSWAQNDINSVVDQNVMTGFNDGMFHPNAWLTRSEFVSMTAKAIGLPPSKAQRIPSLKKVSKNDWGFSNEDNSALLSSYPAGVYRPENPLRRVEMFVGLAGTLKSSLLTNAEADQVLSKYSDADQIPSNVRREVATAIQSNLFAIDPQTGANMIAPLQPANRAEVATVLNSLAQHRELTIVNNGKLIASPNSDTSTASSVSTNSADTATAAAAVNDSANNSNMAGSTSESTAPAAGDSQAATDAAAAGAGSAAAASSASDSNSNSTASNDPTAADPSATRNTHRIGIKTPYRNSADTITETRLVNQTSTATALDPQLLASIPADATFSTTVAKSLYSEFNQVGDPVLLILDHAISDANGNVIIPAGSKLLGQVSRVRSHNATGGAGRLGVKLKSLITPAGQQLPINGTIATDKGVLTPDDMQAVSELPTHSVAALKREIDTAEGSYYGLKQGKTAVLEEPYSAQLSAQPVDAVDKRKNNIILGVGDHVQVRLGSVEQDDSSKN
jgi:S-layer homology domain